MSSELFLAICRPDCPPEERQRGEMEVQAYVQQHVESVWFFVEALAAGKGGDFFDLGCIAMIRWWFSVHREHVGGEDMVKVLVSLLPVMFSKRMAADAVLSVFEDYGKGRQFSSVWDGVMSGVSERLGSSEAQDWVRCLEILKMVVRVMRANRMELFSVEIAMACITTGRRFCGLQAGDDVSFMLVQRAIELMCSALLLQPRVMWLENGPATESMVWFLGFLVEYLKNMPPVIPTCVADTMTTIGKFAYDFLLCIDSTNLMFCEWYLSWYPQVLRVAFQMFKQDSSLVMRNRISSLMCSLALQPTKELWNFPEFLPMISQFVEVPPEERDDYVHNPSQFYWNNYMANVGSCATLRATALNLIVSICDSFSLNEYAGLIKSLDISEAHTRIVTVLIRYIACRCKQIQNPAQNPAIVALSEYMQKILPHMKGEAIGFTTRLIFLSKLVPIIQICYPDGIGMLLTLSLKLLERPPGPILMEIAVKVVKHLYNIGVEIPVQTVPLVIRSLPFAISRSSFRFLISICAQNPGLYQELAPVIGDIILFIANQVGDGCDDETKDVTQVLVYSSMSLLAKIVGQCGESGFGEKLFKLVETCYTLRGLDVCTKLSAIARGAVLKGSPFVGNYLAYFLDVWQKGTNKFVYAYMGDNCPLFLYAMAQDSRAYESGNFLANAYNCLCELLVTKSQHLFADSVYWSSVVISWSLHLFQGVDLAPALKVLESLQVPPNPSTNYESWVLCLAWFDVLASVVLVDRTKVTPEILNNWLSFLGIGLVANKWEINLHATAINAAAETVPEARDAVTSVLSKMQQDPSKMLENTVFPNGIVSYKHLSRYMIPSPRFG